MLLACAPLALCAQTAMQARQDSSMDAFYAWWMLLTGLIFGRIFYVIWRIRNQETRFISEKMDGVFWFSWALTIWGVSGLCDLLSQTMSVKMGAIIFKSVFSTLNSVLILFVLPSIEIQTESRYLNRITALCKHKAPILSIAFLSFLLTLGILLYLITANTTFKQYLSDASLAMPPAGYLLYIPDIVFSFATILVLLQVLSAAFKDKKRGVSPLLWVVYLTLFTTMLAEISLLFPAWTILPPEHTELIYVLSATLFKTLLITLFSFLLYSYEKKKAEEQRLEGLLPAALIKKRWNLDEREVKVLQLLAEGKTRDEIGEDETLFPRQRASARKNVDDLLGKIPHKFGLPENNRTQQMILLFALHHKIIQFDHFSDDSAAGNFSGAVSGNISAEK